MRKLVLIVTLMMAISALSAVCLIADCPIARARPLSEIDSARLGDQGAGMPDGRVYLDNQPPYPYLPTQRPKGKPGTYPPPIEPPD